MVSNPTLVVLIPGHHDVAIHSPRRSPTIKIYNMSKPKSVEDR